MKTKKKNLFLTVIKWILIVLGMIAVLAAIYVGSVYFSYHRIPDNQALETNVVKTGDISSVVTDAVPLDTELTAITYNIGFGAYTPDFSFFMDGGKSSVAKSEESVIGAVSGAANLTAQYDPDFLLFQEVDLNATRSYHVDETDIINQFYDGYYSTDAVNFDSAFLLVPPWEPHGKSLSSLYTLTKYPVDSSIRRSLPVSDGFTKLFDLDRCYSIVRVPTEDGKYLCIYTVHLSAYGMDASVRAGQTSMLTDDINQDVEAGNYVICGGDFNHDLLAEDASECEVEWAQPFPREIFSNGVHFALDDLSRDERSALWESCRNANIPYEEGVSFTVMLDGFVISDNIKVTSYDVVKTGYQYSDHDPVVMSFKLVP